MLSLPNHECGLSFKHTICVSKNLSFSYKLSNSLIYSFTQKSLATLFISVRSVVILLSFLVSVICVFSHFFFFVRLAKTLSILLIFSESKLLVYEIFLLLSTPYSIDFISKISVISFSFCLLCSAGSSFPKILR